MKKRNIITHLCMIVFAFSMLICNGIVACADPGTEFIYYNYFYELEEVDKYKVINIAIDNSAKSKSSDVQTVIKYHKGRVFDYNTYTFSDEIETFNSNEVSGVLYKLDMEPFTSYKVSFYSNGNDNAYIIKSEDNDIVKYEYNFNNFSDGVCSIDCSSSFKKNTVYFWVENDKGGISVKAQKTYSKEIIDIIDNQKDYIAKDSDEVYIYTWNDELVQRMEYFYKKYPKYKDKVKCINLNLGGISSDYVSLIKELAWNKNNNTSIIAMDSSVVDYMISSQKFASMKSLGLEDDYENAYDFTKKYGSYKGKLYLPTWQACPGNFVYNSVIAKEVLGTDDPIKVQEMIKTPEKFLETAKKMKAAGYYMTTGINSLYDTIYELEGYDTSYDNINVKKAKALSAAMTKNGYDTGNQAWSNDWSNDLCGDKIFGIFGCSWFTNWSMPQEGSLRENYKICAGPLTYSWGGTYLGVTNQNKNQKLAALVIQTLCCDEDVMTEICKEDADYVNNKVVNLQFAADSKMKASNGQNNYDVWNQMALAISNEDSISLTKPLKKNASAKVGKVTYKINNLSKTAVTYAKTTDKKSSIKIPDTVTIRGVKYKVTEIGANALKNNKKITKLTVGKNVTTIGKEAFKGCKKLKTVNIKSTSIKKIGKNALRGTNNNLTIKVPSKKLSKYKKYFKNKGNKTVKVTN